MRLLLAEDDALLSAGLKKRLESVGYAVDASGDGEHARLLGRSEDYDAVVLDLGLPGRNGLDVLRDWRQAGRRMPVLILTARDAWYDKVEGFEAGADDYLAKPFHPEELLARLRALLRRAAGRAEPELEESGLRLDPGRQIVLDHTGQAIELTGVEFRLLRYFMSNAGITLSKQRLTDHVYGLADEHESNVIEVYVNRLRQKIGREKIRTRRGQGYVFGGPTS